MRPFQCFSFALGIIVCMGVVAFGLYLKGELTHGTFVELESESLPMVFEFRGKLYQVRRAYTELDVPDR